MIELRRPDEKLIVSYLEFLDEMRAAGEKVWDGMVPEKSESNAQFVDRLLRQEVQPSPGLVAESTFWACEENQVIGRIALRHELNENLKEFGGHIGYEVRPSCRRQGFAKEMLKQVLGAPKAREIGKLLLTCAPDNIASNKTIAANGGTLTKTAFVKKWDRETNYYWIVVR